MNGFSPAPIDLHNVNLSRELQVRPLSLPLLDRQSEFNYVIRQRCHVFFFYSSILTSLAFGLSAGHGGGGCGELSQHLGQEEEERAD